MIALAEFRLCERFFDQPLSVILALLSAQACKPHHQKPPAEQDDEVGGVFIHNGGSSK